MNKTTKTHVPQRFNEYISKFTKVNIYFQVFKGIFSDIIKTKNKGIKSE